jgi:hypothetical protein
MALQLKVYFLENRTHIKYQPVDAVAVLLLV